MNWSDRRLIELFGIDHPIVQAPMAGFVSPAMVVAVSEAGGLGSIAGAMATPESLRTELQVVRQGTGRSFSVNFFTHRQPEPDASGGAESPIAELPDNILHNLMPTRYCESDLLSRTAQKLFGDHAPGFARVQAISDWLFDNIDYQVGTTVNTTTASDVFLQRAGVCRDFAHLGITFCRALNIPARLVVGYAPFKEPPPDFHAVFEAWLGGRWVLFDGTRMSPVAELVRIATGRDAKDVAFATIFGPATMRRMNPCISSPE